RRNLLPYGDRVTVVEAALWPRPQSLRLQRAHRADGVRVMPGDSKEKVSCLGVDPLTLLRGSAHNRISLLKCDIEGAEEQLFGAGPDTWLALTDAIVMEIHSTTARSVVYGALEKHGFVSTRYRDLHLFERRPSRDAATRVADHGRGGREAQSSRLRDT